MQKYQNEQTRLMAEICTGVWRVQQNLELATKDQSSDRLRRTARHLSTMVDQLQAAGYLIKNHNGEPYDVGNQVKVLAFEQTEGLIKESVLETIKPSIFYQGDCIQPGEVVVGTPKSEN